MEPRVVLFFLPGRLIDDCLLTQAQIDTCVAMDIASRANDAGEYESAPIAVGAEAIRVALAGLDGIREEDISSRYVFGTVTAHLGLDLGVTLNLGESTPPSTHTGSSAMWRRVAVLTERRAVQEQMWASGLGVFVSDEEDAAWTARGS